MARLTTIDSQAARGVAAGTLLIVSPNLCLDRVVVVRDFAAGMVHRAESATTIASGKGLNVARAATALGAGVRVIGIVGTGAAARAIVHGARAQGIPLDAIRVPGESRVCTLIVDPQHTETVVNEPGPAVPEMAVAALLAQTHMRLRRARVVVLTGSLPPGIKAELYASIIRQAPGIPVILDASGEPLTHGLAARPYLVKVNRQELETVVGRTLATREAVIAGVQEIRRAGTARVLATMGAAGAVLATPDGTWLLTPPWVPRVNAIGAGDSLAAGLAVGLLRGQPVHEAARLGIAAAAADVTTLLPGMVEPARVDELVPRVRLQTLPA